MLYKLTLWGLLATRFAFAEDGEEDNGWDFSGSHKVVHLGDEGFESFLSETERALVMFYAPWCGHCKSMKPDFAAAAKIVSHKATLAAVDCTTQTNACEQFSVNSYPTVKYFDNGSPEDFDGDRSSGAFINFIDKRIPDSEWILTADLSKVPTKVLKKILRQRGVACRGCSERHEFIKLVEEVKHLPKKGLNMFFFFLGSLNNSSLLNSIETPKPKGSSLVNGMTFAQERRHKEAIAVAEEVWQLVHFSIFFLFL